MSFRLFSVIIGLLLLAACSRSPVHTLPQGIQTLTGVLLPTEISLLRRGTHLLKIDGEVRYYVESAKVNLRAYEGRKIGLRGTIEPNIDASYEPVFVVEDILLGTQVTFTETTLPSLEVRLSVPTNWQAHELGKAVRFTATGSAIPLLLILEQRRDELPFDFDRLKPEAGVSMSQMWIGSSRAVRVTQEQSGNQTVFIERDESMNTRLLALAFTPDVGGEFAEQDTLFTAILQSIRFEKKTAQSSAAKPKTDDTQGKPCGGSAGILCPSGFYCQVTDWETSIGKCRKL